MPVKAFRWIVLVALLAVIFGSVEALAQGELPGNLEMPELHIPDIKIEPKPGSKLSPNLQTSFLLISLGLIPYIMICTTSYIRTTITLSYLKSGLGSTQALSNQIMVGICMMITLNIMWPVWSRVNETAIQPYLKGTIEQEQFMPKFLAPVRDFMIKQTRDKDIALFCELGGYGQPKTYGDIPLNVIVPSFIMSEVKTGFMIGFLIYLPFLMVDMIVASVLMSMGMFMLSPMTISLPFKLMLMITIDGWHILIIGLVKSFNRPDWMGPPPV